MTVLCGATPWGAGALLGHLKRSSNRAPADRGQSGASLRLQEAPAALNLGHLDRVECYLMQADRGAAVEGAAIGKLAARALACGSGLR